jgi:preprotein translocase subunit SecA
VLTHPLITRSIEQAQKRVELQNFQSRKRLLEYDDVMNQQREVIYSLRSFALEGGEELKGEARKMIEKAVARRIETSLTGESAEQWDWGVLQEDLLRHYLLQVPEFADEAARPANVAESTRVAVEAGHKAFDTKLQSLVLQGDDGSVIQQYGDQLLALVMLNVLDEKWKDHLYDLDQLRAAIHYRSWGQKDPLVEYKQEAYTMFLDLMNDIYNTFTERFLRVQLVFEPQPGEVGGDGGAPPSRVGPPAAPARKKRYNALGILEDAPDDEEPAGVSSNGDGADGDEPRGAMDVGPAPQPSTETVAARPEPTIVGAGRPRSLSAAATGLTGTAGAAGTAGSASGNTDWSTVGRNDPCPCGSGKKFKKCHGAHL